MLPNAVPELEERDVDLERPGMGPVPLRVRYGTYLLIQTQSILSQERFEEFSLLIQARLTVLVLQTFNFLLPLLLLIIGLTVCLYTTPPYPA